MKNHIAITSCPEIAEIMLPQLSQHGITVFNYYRIYFDGRVVRLSSDQAWTEHYFEKNYMNTMTVPKDYIMKPLNYYVWLTEDCPEMLLDAALNFDTSNGITLAVKHPEYIEYFCFATTLQNTRIINQFYLNNLDVLHKYGLEFLGHAKNILKRAEKNTLQIINPEVCHADCRPANLGLDGSLQSAITLTNRQSECARLLLQGKKYKEIAVELNLSTRTIESYIDILKNKLQCQNRTELALKLVEYV
jgi:LuxR family quorum-sensing system transcriptional regulator SolR